MRMLPLVLLLIIAVIIKMQARNSLIGKLPAWYLSHVQTRSDQFLHRLDKQTEETLSRLLRLEEEMKARLHDNTEIKSIFSDSLSNLRIRIRKRVLIPGPGTG